MQELLLVNPRKRGAKRSAKRRSPAQRRATAKLVASNRARRRRNPVSALPVAAKKRYRRVARRAANPIRSRRRRNPDAGNTSISSLLKSAAIGAAGATAVNFVATKLPLPATLPIMGRHAVKALLAVGLGTLGRRVLGRNAVDMARGSLTVIMTDAIKETAAKAGMNLGYYSPAIQRNRPQMIAAPAPRAYRNSTYDGAGLGEYVS